MSPPVGAGPSELSGQRIVFLNWRDRRHPRAGGAELYCQSVAERFAAAGAHVTLVTARAAGSPAVEDVNGVSVIRRGGALTVYLAAAMWLIRNRASVDAVVDFQNGIPFLSPLFVPRHVPIACVIFHVHQEQFRAYFRRPISDLGRFLEKTGTRFAYRRRAVVAISPSTRVEIRRRLRLPNPIFLAPCGIDQTSRSSADSTRSREPSIAVVGRLVPHKRLDLLLDAMPAILDALPSATLVIAGDGPARSDLARRIDALGLSASVILKGRVTDDERDDLLRSSWLTVNPSAGEGWGLSVIEANAHGVPAVAFHVPGLQDSVVDGRTGWLVDEGQPLASTIVAALRRLADPREAAAWSRRTRSWAAGFDWDSTAQRILAVLDTERDRLANGWNAADRRRSSDLSVRVSWQSPAVPALVSRRRTDQLVTLDGAHQAVLHGADELQAAAVFARWGLDGGFDADVARDNDLLAPGSDLAAASVRLPTERPAALRSGR